MKEKSPFETYRKKQNLDFGQRRTKEQVMQSELDRLCRKFLAEDSRGENPIVASYDSYEFVSEFFDKYHKAIIMELYGEVEKGEKRKQAEEQRPSYYTGYLNEWENRQTAKEKFEDLIPPKKDPYERLVESKQKDVDNYIKDVNNRNEDTGVLEGGIENLVQDAEDFLMVVLEKIRAEAERGKLVLPSIKAKK
jgi:hypothetical protein